MQVTSSEPAHASAAGPMNAAIRPILRAIGNVFGRRSDASLVNEKFTDDFERQLQNRTLRTRAWVPQSTFSPR